MTITEAFEAFIMDELEGENRSQKTIDSYICTQNSLLRSLGDDILISLFVYGHIIQWKKDMHDWDNRLTYICQQLRNFRRVLSYLRERGYDTLDPKYIKIPKGAKYRETAWLTQEEMARFLGVIDNPMYKALFSMQFSAGARIFEILQLDRSCESDLFATKSAKVRGKGKKEATDILFFDDNALEALKLYLDTRIDRLEPMFVSRQGNRPHITTVIQTAHKYAKKAGITKNVATHVMRHSFGTNLDLNGMDIYDVSKQLRHSRIETTKIYIHSGDTNRRAEYDKFHSPAPIKDAK